MKTANKPGPTKKGVRPNTEGVQGEILEAAAIPDGLAFSDHKVRSSPYDGPLRGLQGAAGKVLRFADRRAYVSVKARAKKLGLAIETAEAEGVLYVRMKAGPEKPVPDGKACESRRDRILAIVRQAPGLVTLAILKKLREAGDGQADDGIVGRILNQLIFQDLVVERAHSYFPAAVKA